MPQFSLVKDILRNAQRKFWGLDLGQADMIPGLVRDGNLVQADVSRALADPSMAAIASSFIAADDRIVDGQPGLGAPLVTFSRILKGQEFPLPRILASLLKVSEACIGVPVEIEFAVDLKPDGPQTFHVLQVRPMNLERPSRTAAPPEPLQAEAIVFSPSTLGHGRSGGIRDIIAIPWDLDRARTREAAQAIEAINRGLRQDGRPSLIIGPGRWGSADPWLGIPVTWPQISTAKAIVETDFLDLEVEPSQGSHFFHNLTSFGVAYFTIHRHGGGGTIDWDWLERQPAQRVELDGKLRHYRLEASLEIRVDGVRGMGAILRES